MIALVDKPESRAVHDILIKIADTYPQVISHTIIILYYYFMVHAATVDMSFFLSIVVVLCFQNEQWWIQV